jgi:hypothetical protein
MLHDEHGIIEFEIVEDRQTKVCSESVKARRKLARLRNISKDVSLFERPGLCRLSYDSSVADFSSKKKALEARASWSSGIVYACGVTGREIDSRQSIGR